MLSFIFTDQCDCTQDNFYTTIFVPARETSSVLEIATNHQIDVK